MKKQEIKEEQYFKKQSFLKNLFSKFLYFTFFIYLYQFIFMRQVFIEDVQKYNLNNLDMLGWWLAAPIIGLVGALVSVCSKTIKNKFSNELLYLKQILKLYGFIFVGIIVIIFSLFKLLWVGVYFGLILGVFGIVVYFSKKNRDKEK